MQTTTKAVSAARLATMTVAAFTAVLAAGCAEDDSAGTVRVWCHQGQEAENLAMRGMVEAFNAAHADRGVRLHIEFFPDSQYDEKLSSAAAAGDLPDVVDLDGPMLARYVDAGLLQPVDPWVSTTERQDFIRTIIEQGTIDGRLYALGAFDSALVLYYDKVMLEKAGVEPASESTPWTWDEFLAACRKLKTAGLKPVAMHMGDPAHEWFTYAFSPLLWSGGGAMIDTEAGRVEGVLNSAANVRTLTAWQQVFSEALADTDPVDPDPFAAGETAMDWNGHWRARSHQQAKGDRLGAMPLPRVGDREVVPSGSWCWGLGAKCGDPESAMLWIRWVTDPEHGIKPIVEANGAVPARKSAFVLFPEYDEMPYRLFREQLQKWGRPRPRTPQYAALTQQVASALRDIAHGADVKERLDAAAAAVQRVIDRRK